MTESLSRRRCKKVARSRSNDEPAPECPRVLFVSGKPRSLRHTSQKTPRSPVFICKQEYMAGSGLRVQCGTHRERTPGKARATETTAPRIAGKSDAQTKLRR